MLGNSQSTDHVRCRWVSVLIRHGIGRKDQATQAATSDQGKKPRRHSLAAGRLYCSSAFHGIPTFNPPKRAYTMPVMQRERARGRTDTRWPSPDGSLVAYVEADRDNILQVYRIKPELIGEHFGTEQSVLSSGYRYRQIFEVVQNAADAILEAADAGEDGGRILVRVTQKHLYVGNTGAPLSKDGIIALLGANSSRKRKNQIGRFGLGFKSLLALGGTIDLFSRSVSIRFDPAACQRTISEEFKAAARRNAARATDG